MFGVNTFHYLPELVKVYKNDWSEQIKKSMMEGKQFIIENGPTVFNSLTNINLNLYSKKFRINLIGITGSGKTTTAEKIQKIIEDKGGKVLIVSADKWSKQNFKGSNLQNQIFNEIKQFDIKPCELKVIIMDLCNENGISKNSFGFNFNAYTDINFYPNLIIEKFNEYECWCLKNVLSRPKHSTNSNYWLNPISAGVETCIKVHNLKANGISQLLNVKRTNYFNQKMSLFEIMEQIKTKSNNYKKLLENKNLDLEINKFINENIQM